MMPEKMGRGPLVSSPAIRESKQAIVSNKRPRQQCRGLQDRWMRECLRHPPPYAAHSTVVCEGAGCRQEWHSATMVVRLKEDVAARFCLKNPVAQGVVVEFATLLLGLEMRFSPGALDGAQEGELMWRLAKEVRTMPASADNPSLVVWLPVR